MYLRSDERGPAMTNRLALRIAALRGRSPLFLLESSFSGSGCYR